MWLRVIVTLACCCISTASFAQGTDQHVLGTVTAIDEKHIEVKTPMGVTVGVQINKKTLYKDKNNPKGASVPDVGDRVIIKATKSDKKNDKLLLATEINFSAATRVPVPLHPVTVQ